MTVIITENGKNAKRLDPKDFDSEGELQEYIYENPEALPMYEIDEDIRVLILMREFPTNSGPIDALGVDANGNIPGKEVLFPLMVRVCIRTPCEASAMKAGRMPNLSTGVV